MTPEEYAAFEGLGLAALIGRREASVAEVTAAARAAKPRANLGINAGIKHYEDRFAKPADGPGDGPFRAFRSWSRMSARLSVAGNASTAAATARAWPRPMTGTTPSWQRPRA
jgi:hypothetical protein